jgi:hypothetical protein
VEAGLQPILRRASSRWGNKGDTSLMRGCIRYLLPAGGAAVQHQYALRVKDDQLCEYFPGGDRAADSNAAADIVRIPVDEIGTRTSGVLKALNNTLLKPSTVRGNVFAFTYTADYFGPDKSHLY